MNHHFHPRHHTRRSPQPPPAQPLPVGSNGAVAAPTFADAGLEPQRSPSPRFVGTSPRTAADSPHSSAHHHGASGYLDLDDSDDEPAHGHGRGHELVHPAGDETDETEAEEEPEEGATGHAQTEGAEEEDEQEGDDAASDTSSADYDPDADPEGFAKRLDELAGVKEVGVREERAVRVGPVLGLLPGEKRGKLSASAVACLHDTGSKHRYDWPLFRLTLQGNPPALPFDQFKRFHDTCTYQTA